MVQSELLRAVEKLRDSAIRNGDANWDQDVNTLLSYLSNHPRDAAVFSSHAVG